MAAHDRPRMTNLYDRTKERLTQDDVEGVLRKPTDSDFVTPGYSAGVAGWVVEGDLLGPAYAKEVGWVGGTASGTEFSLPQRRSETQNHSQQPGNPGMRSIRPY